MKIWQDGYRTIYQDDARSMFELSDNSIHCVVSYPPYYGLRKYHEVPDLIWGGSNPECKHVWGDTIPSGGYRSSDSNPGKLQSVATCERTKMVSQFCQSCVQSGIRICVSGTMLEPNETKTLGWRATCKCQTDKVLPALVCDPFLGSGTTLQVAAEMGRRAVGYELSPKYIKLALERNKQ